MIDGTETLLLTGSAQLPGLCTNEGQTLICARLAQNCAQGNRAPNRLSIVDLLSTVASFPAKAVFRRLLIERKEVNYVFTLGLYRERMLLGCANNANWLHCVTPGVRYWETGLGETLRIVHFRMDVVSHIGWAPRLMS